MNQGNQEQSTPRLHPVLQGALRSLDVNLESELKRYRRQKTGELPRPSGMTASYQNGKGSDVMSVMAGLPALQNPWLLTAQSDGDRALNMPEVRPEENHRNREQQGGDLSLALTAAAGSTGDDLGATMLTAISRTAPDKEVAITELEKEPDDYLESSEELLKSLASPAEAEAVTWKNPERKRKNNLLTPLGIGSILLLLMTGGTLWFVGTDPFLVRHLKRSRLRVESNPEKITKTTYPKQVNTNISERAAVDLNLDSLSTLPTSPSSSPQPVESPAVRQRSPQVEPKLPINSPVIPQPSVQIPAVVPIPRTRVSGARDLRASGLSTIGTDAAFEQYYYVVTPDRGEDSLEKIAEIIPEATVRDFPQGRKIQLGVFREEARALSLVEKLAGQGISAQIYKHRY